MRREDTGRMPIPPLIVEATCPLCRGSVDHTMPDCPWCGVEWDRNGLEYMEDGKPRRKTVYDPDTRRVAGFTYPDQCTATYEHDVTQIVRGGKVIRAASTDYFRCVLDAGHGQGKDSNRRGDAHLHRGVPINLDGTRVDIAALHENDPDFMPEDWPVRTWKPEESMNRPVGSDETVRHDDPDQLPLHEEMT